MIDECKLESIFANVLPLPDDQRSAYLEDACAGDTELRQRVDALLRASVEAGSFFDKLPAAFVPTIVAGELDTVDEAASEISLEFLTPTDKPNCLGTLGQYEVIEVVGRGGMGIVLRAYDTKLNRVVAIKMMASELAANAIAVKRFLREARAAAAVSHDHVVTIHAIEEDNRPPFIVMEFVDGQSLQEKIDRHGALELDGILRIGLQMARGLEAAHEQGLVHRDIKPANILLENGVERVKLTDFGLARAVDDVSVTQTGQIAGTPQFMSPEQAQGHAIDARSDLFSLGSVLYTMCTGRPPFRADSAVAMLRRVTDDEPRFICEVNSDIPDWLEAIVFKLLAKEPDERFQSAEEVAELLSQHLAHLQHPTTVPQPPRVEHKRAEQRLFDLDEELGFIETTLRIYAWIALMWAVPAIIFAVLVNVIPGNFTATFFRLNAPGELVTGVLSLGTSFLSFMGLSQVRRRDSYGKAMAGNVAAMLPVNPFLVFVVPWSICSIIKLRNPKVRTAFHPAKRLNRSWFNIEAAAAIFGLLILFAVAGILIYVRTDNGTIRVEVNDPNTTITIDDERGISLQNADSGILTVRAGEHKLHIQQGELEFGTDSFRVKRGEDVIVRVELIDDKLGARLITPQVERRDGGSGTTFRDRVIGKHGDNRNVESVAIRTREGFYWRAVDGGRSGIMADVKEAGPTEAFKFEWQDDTRSTAWIRTRDGFYVRGILNRDGKLETTKQRGTSELFQVEWDRNQKTFRLRTRDGLYVHAPTGGGSFLDMTKSPGSSEVFTLVAIPEQRAWLQLFNGKDLTGWKTHPDQPGGWTVEDGVLIGRGDARSHLFSERGDFEDFHLRAEAKINDTGNGGIFFRGGFGLPKGRGFPDGYEAQILNGVNFFDVGKPELQLTGSLYTLQPFTDRLAQPNEWFTLEIIAKANHITIKVNGRTTADYVDAENTYGQGHIVLQSLSHTEPVLQRTVIEFRRIEVQDLTRAADLSSQLAEIRRLEGHSDVITAVSISPDGRWLFSGSEKLLIQWDLAAGIAMRKIPVDSPVKGVAVLPDGEHVITSHFDGKVTLWNLASGRAVRDFSGHRQKVFAIAVSADGKRLLTGDHDGLVRLWDIETGEPLHSFSEEYCAAVAMSRDGRLAAHGDGHCDLVVWNVESGNKIQQIRRPRGTINTAAFSPDGQHLVSGDQYGVVEVWEVATGKPLYYFDDHAGRVTSLHFTPDGRHFVSGSEDKTIRVVELARGREVSVTKCDSHYATHLAIAPDGRTLASGGGYWLELRDRDRWKYALRRDGDYAIRLWQLPESVWPKTASERALGAVVWPETRQALQDLILAAREASTDEEWESVLRKHVPLLDLTGEANEGESEVFGEAEMAEMQNGGRKLIELLAGLPDAAHEDLLQAGYLKWRFSEVEEPRQGTIRDALTSVFAASSKMGFPTGLKDHVPEMLATGDVGFAFVDVAEGQGLIWYLHLPTAPIPMTFPIFGAGQERDDNVFFSKSVYKQLGELEDQPYSDLPQENLRPKNESQVNVFPIPSKPHPEVDAIVQQFRSADVAKRVDIVRSLQSLGRENDAARVAALRALLDIARNSTDETVVKGAFHAVEEVGEEGDIAAWVTVPAMVAYMNDNKNPLTRRLLSARVIGNIGEQRPHLEVVESSIAALIAKLDSRESDLVEMALWSLGQIGETSPDLVRPAIPAISRIATTHELEATRIRASAVLREIEAADKNVSGAQEPDREFIQGTWNCLSAITSGKELPNEQSAGRSWTFAGETFFEPAIQRPRRGKFVLDTATDPKQIDLHIPAEQDGFVVIRGIYELKGDRLTICMQEDFTAVKRPTDFTTVPGDKRSLLVFQRATDRELLQGTWQVVALEGAGQTAPENSFSEKRFLFAGDRLSRTGMPEDLHSFRLNAASTPKQIDIGSGVEGQFSKAIYELEGDTLRLCFSQQTRLDRPKEFDTEGTRYFCFTLKRFEQ